MERLESGLISPSGEVYIQNNYVNNMFPYLTITKNNLKNFLVITIILILISIL